MMARLHVWGPKALFVRPEFRRDLVSYDVITPPAARGIFDAVYWRRGITWNVRRISILNPISFSGVGASTPSLPAAVHGCALADVSYVIDAELLVEDGGADGRAVHLDRFTGRVDTASSEGRLFLGRPRFPAMARLLHSDDPQPEPSPSLAGVHDFGWLMHSIAFHDDGKPRFFRAVATDGVITVPGADGSAVFA
jgi:CRISPR-associated protein Cas5d